MSASPETLALLTSLRKVRQIRQYNPEPVAPELIDELIQIARWTGSSRNTQPWRFIAVSDKEQLRKLSEIRTPINWVAAAPFGLAIVLDGANPLSEAYDEGRITERLMIAAHLLGLGGGIAWYGDEGQQATAKQILGIPAELTARAIVAIGHPITYKDPRPNAVAGGRKPLSEILSHNRFGVPSS
jgi:nitroreductase